MDIFDSQSYEDEPEPDDDETIVCPHCGKKSIKYKYSFNKGHAVFLRKLYEAGGPVRTNSLGLTYPQRTNSQKLRYWDLARQVPSHNDESKKKLGCWEITDKGRQFALGLITIPKIAVVRDNVVLRLEGAEILVSDVEDGYKYRADYVDQAREQMQSQ